MPRSRNKTDRPSEHLEGHVVRLQVDNMDRPVNEEVAVDSQGNLIQDTTTQPEQRPQLRPRKLKLPNFLSSQIDNFANYLGPVPPGVVAPRSASADRNREKIRTEGGGWSWTRVQSLDRETREEAPILSFIGPSQVFDPYQEGVDHDEASAAAAHNSVETDEVDEDSIASKDADCLIG